MSSHIFPRCPGSGCSSSSFKQTQRQTKRLHKALFDELDVPVKSGRVVSFSSANDERTEATQMPLPSEKVLLDEADDSFGFSCGGRLPGSYSFGCGGIDTTASMSPKISVVGRVKAIIQPLIQEKFSSRTDYSPSDQRQRLAVNFVEHRV